MVWYKTQHEHWLGWLSNYNGPGANNRMDAIYTREQKQLTYCEKNSMICQDDLCRHFSCMPI